MDKKVFFEITGLFHWKEMDKIIKRTNCVYTIVCDEQTWYKGKVSVKQAFSGILNNFA